VPDIPSDPGAVDAGWVDRALRSHGVECAPVIAVDVQEMTEEQGLVSRLARITVSYAEAGNAGPPSLVLKLAPGDPARREELAPFGLYEREVCLYRDLAPVAHVPAADHYFAAVSADGRDFSLLLEDLKSSSHGDDLKGLDTGGVLAAVTGLAQMHTSWWQAPALERADWLRKMSVWHPNIEAIRDYWPSFFDRFEAVLPDEARRFGPACAPGMHRVLDDLSARPSTLVHGDLKPSNIFFPSGRPPKLIDWQFVGHAPGALDISYLLAIGLSVDDRRNIEWEALHAWHDHLSPEVRAAYSYQDAVNDYRRSAAITCLVNPVFGSQYVDLSTPMAEACFRASVTSRFVAALDFGLDQLLL
jgi:aminoglycoside phosphotransferase (APT) family kinase protein